jgi:LacI family transcriptional regulator
MNKPTTLKDIAIKLKLSPSSVSKALRCCPDIGDKTKQRVHSYVRKIGYQSNPIGANLRTKRTYLVGVIVPDVTDPFYAQAVSGIISVIDKSRYHVIIAQSKDDKTLETNLMQDLANRWVDGLIVLTPFSLLEPTRLKKLIGRQMPIVMVNGMAGNIFNSDKPSDLELAHRATKMLIRLGHRSIACITQTQQLPKMSPFMAGYRSALADHQILFDAQLVRLLSNQTDHIELKSTINDIESRVATRAWIITGKEFITGFLAQVTELKININGMKMHFFSDTLLCIYGEPLVKEMQSDYELGTTAAQALLKKIENNKVDLSRIPLAS